MSTAGAVLIKAVPIYIAVLLNKYCGANKYWCWLVSQVKYVIPLALTFCTFTEKGRIQAPVHIFTGISLSWKVLNSSSHCILHAEMGKKTLAAVQGWDRLLVPAMRFCIHGLVSTNTNVNACGMHLWSGAFVWPTNCQKFDRLGYALSHDNCWVCLLRIT